MKNAIFRYPSLSENTTGRTLTKNNEKQYNGSTFEYVKTILYINLEIQEIYDIIYRNIYLTERVRTDYARD